MITAYCPGHVTCFYQPVDSNDLMRKGSRGAGIRLSLGSTVTLEECRGERINIRLNGKRSTAPITRDVVRELIPTGGLNVDVKTDLPISQGFGMSAAGAIAAGLCACEYKGLPLEKAYSVAHLIEVMSGGGLGDVAALKCLGHQPIREKPGLIGDNVRDSGIAFENITLAIIGKKIPTSIIIHSSNLSEKISSAGQGCVDEYVQNPSKDALFRIANRFSAQIGLESEPMRAAMRELSKNEISSLMCMLGNTMLIDAPIDRVREILGKKVELISCSSSAESARIIQKE